MPPIERWQFSFLYRRQGQTSLWKFAKADSPKKLDPGDPWDGPGARAGSGGSDAKHVWIDVGMETEPDADPGELIGGAELQADAFFKANHPGADLAADD